MKNKEIVDLQKNVEVLTKSLDNLNDKLDDFEQYGRRTSIRMHNVNYASSEDDACTETAVNVIRNLMKVDLRADDIERCHSVGKPNQKGVGPLFIKFKSYRCKKLIYKAILNLKGNPDKIFVNGRSHQK